MAPPKSRQHLASVQLRSIPHEPPSKRMALFVHTYGSSPQNVSAEAGRKEVGMRGAWSGG